jgi:hypothetical protein
MSHAFPGSPLPPRGRPGAGHRRNLVPPARIDHGEEKVDRLRTRPRRTLPEHPREPSRLQKRGIQRKSLSARGWKQLTLAAVLYAWAGLDIVPADQFLEDAIETLLGDFQNVQQLGDREPRTPGDEMQHPVMRPAKPKGNEETIGIAGKIAIGEEHELDQFEHRRARFGGGRERRPIREVLRNVPPASCRIHMHGRLCQHC